MKKVTLYFVCLLITAACSPMRADKLSNNDHCTTRDTGQSIILTCESDGDSGLDVDLEINKTTGEIDGWANDVSKDELIDENVIASSYF